MKNTLEQIAASTGVERRTLSDLFGSKYRTFNVEDVLKVVCYLKMSEADKEFIIMCATKDFHKDNENYLLYCYCLYNTNLSIKQIIYWLKHKAIFYQHFKI